MICIAGINQQRRWKLPIRWQVSTPPSIPKKSTNKGALSKMQAFLSKYTMDSDASKEPNNIYKQPPPTPKSCREGSASMAGFEINTISKQQIVPAEVIQSWLHSSFHANKDTGQDKAGRRRDFPRRNNSDNGNKEKRKSLGSRPISNCYETIEGNLHPEEAIYETVSENDDNGSDDNSYASVQDREYMANGLSNSKPVYANMEGPPFYKNYYPSV